jgi:phosphinothricin acetyltransferase
MDITIRLATPEDAEALLGIYSYYVENTPITYELKCPTVEDFRNRIAKVLKAYPYLVAELDDSNLSPLTSHPSPQIIGYCYASRFRERAAYDHCVEMSIYIDKGAHHEGIGTALYEELEKRLYAQGIRNLYASITASAEPSIHFHAKHGYTKVAHFHKCGRKFDQWLDMIWMEKILE